MSGLDRLEQLDAANCPSLHDLGGLSDLEALDALDLSGCGRVTDLRPLTRLGKLTSLSLARCALLTDLTPLGEVRSLTRLDLSHARSLADLTPLGHIDSLRFLDLGWCGQIMDLSPLPAVRSLRQLTISNIAQLNDIRPLGDLAALTWLDMSHCPDVTDLAPLSSLTALRVLHLDGCSGWADATPLGSLLALEVLGLAQCRALRDVAPLATLSCLRKLALNGVNRLEDLEPLQSLEQLRELGLAGTARELDVTPLGGLTSIRRIDHDRPEVATRLLASAAAARGDIAFVAPRIRAWVDLVASAADPDPLTVAIVDALAAAGLRPWTAGILLDLVGVLRESEDRPVARGGFRATRPTWARVYDTAAALPDPGRRETFTRALEPGATVAWVPERTLPALAALAAVATTDDEAEAWASALGESTLERYKDPRHARRIAPAAARFHATLGQDERVREWLDLATEPAVPLWRDRVALALVERAVSVGDVRQARARLDSIRTRAVRDQARVALARSLAASQPERVAEEIDDIEDPRVRGQLADELANDPQVTRDLPNLHALLMALQDDPDRLAELLNRIVRQHPDGQLARLVAEEFGDIDLEKY